MGFCGKQSNEMTQLPSFLVHGSHLIQENTVEVNSNTFQPSKCNFACYLNLMGVLNRFVDFTKDGACVCGFHIRWQIFSKSPTGGIKIGQLHLNSTHPYGKFRKLLTQGECEFQVDKLTWHFYIKYLLPLW